MNIRRYTTIAILLFIPFVFLRSADVLNPKDVLMMKRVSNAVISPNGEWIAYTVSVPREATDKAGPAYNELYVISTKTKEVRPFIVGKELVYAVAWKPDASAITFIAARGEGATPQVWMIPIDGGEAVPLTRAETGVNSFGWSPAGDRLAYVSVAPRTAKEKKLDGSGFGFVYVDEDLKHRNLYLVNVSSAMIVGAPQQLTKDISVWSSVFAPDGKSMAVAASPRNHVDDSYMFQRIHLLNIETGMMTQISKNSGKLGNFAFSPDGKYLAYAAAFDRKDHAVSQAFVVPAAGGEVKNVTPPKFRGHARWVDWKDASTLLYGSAEATTNTISSVDVAGGERTILLNSGTSGIVFSQPSFTKDMRTAAFVGNTAGYPGDLFIWSPGKEAERLTVVNAWLAGREMGKQEVIRYKSRDGVEIRESFFTLSDTRKG